jgi:hypothetical protein
MEIPRSEKKYPHATDLLIPEERFFIGKKICCLYKNIQRMDIIPYSLYWHDETNPIGTALTTGEVFHCLATLLEKEQEKE